MKELDFLMSNLIAHRGMHNLEKGIPENSLKAFELAMINNYIIELDLHLLKDNSVVVFHDDNLERMTGINKDIKDVKYNEIKELNLGGTKYGIPLLSDVLKLINGKVPLIIEFKYDSKAGLLEQEAMKILKNYKGKYAVKSFNPFSILWFKKNYPEIIRGQLVSSYESAEVSGFLKFLLKNMFFNFITKPDFISYSINELPNKKAEKFRRSKPVLGWVIKNKEDMEKAKKYCDNYIFENIEEIILFDT